ncbi:MAG TPA: response regulator [Gemmatimonadota bacterium]|nr:response regulator [Gemmatimonadota bacterium]
MDAAPSTNPAGVPVLVLTDDLFFRAKIEATAAAAGVRVAFARGLEDLLSRPDAGRRTTVLIDLAARSVDPPAAIRALKAGASSAIVIAFGSHQDREGLKNARAAGADQVLARSTFTERLADLLRQGA